MNNLTCITKVENVILVNRNFQSKTNFTFRNNLEWHELIFHFHGTATVCFGKETFHTKAPTIRYLPKVNTEKYTVSIEKGHEECIDIFFLCDPPLAPNAFIIQPIKNEKIGFLFKKLFLLWCKKENGYYHESLSLVYKILAELQRQNYLSNEQFQKIEPAINYIDENFNKEAIPSEKLVSLCHISYSYIKRLFVLKYNLTPNKYILHLKMNYACDLLQTGLYSITQTAQMVGYDDVYFFSHQFKKHFGISPSKFKTNYNRGD